MTPTEINILVAVLALILGGAIVNVYKVNKYFDGFNDCLAGSQLKEAKAFEIGFHAGVELADNEDAEGDAEIGELLKKGYLTWEELDQLEDLDMLNDLPEDVFVR